MSELKVRLLSGDDPQGKQKVYFCCHPDDFADTFDLLCGDIVSRESNCAIYYEADPHGGYDREELLFQLGEMQLFIVPVTKRLLSEPNRAMELELPFALGQTAAADGKSRHVAVLPVLFGGSGVKDAFNASRVFQDIQYLDRYAEDSTGLSYEEKLKQFLRSVIVSGEEAARIRSEFRAGIFLSYRKMDRTAARRLMERIHREAFCRDVAIWYDEYLVPGESWRKGIEEALAGCDLFILNVTPKLLAAGNFVWREEYPNARKSGRPILSVVANADEMSAADMATLKTMYPEIEKNLAGEDGKDDLAEHLRRSLIEKAGKAELLTPDDRAEHLYYIGLGYKNSVGVESDPAKAVRLLERAGENGYRRAYLTLGHAYECGDGVERDEDRAIRYYEEFIRLQTPDFGTDQQGDLDLVNAYDAKGMILLGRSRLQDAFDTYAELHARIDAMTSCFGSFKQFNLPTSLERLGNIKRAMGDPDAARAFYERALEARLHPTATENIATAEDRNGEDAEEYNRRHGLYGLAVNLYCIGENCLRNRDLQGARENLFRANEIFEALDKEKKERDLKINLAKSYGRAAEVCAAEGKRGEAKVFYEKAVSAVVPLCNNAHDREARAVHAVGLVSLSGWYRDGGQYQNADRFLRVARAEAEGLYEEERDHRARNLLAVVYERMGTLEELLGRPNEARKFLEKNVEIAEELAAETEDAEFQRGLAVGYEKLARFITQDPDTMSMEDLRRACELLEKDLLITKQLVHSKTDIQGQRDLSVCYAALSEVWLYRDPKKALEYAVKDLTIAYRLAKEPGEPQELYELGVSYFNVGKICGDLKDRCFRNAMTLWSSAYRQMPLPELKDKLAVIRELMGHPATECAIAPGYCGSLKELTDRWSEDGENIDYADVSRFGARASGAGCLPTLLALTLLAAMVLQLTGAINVMGPLESALGSTGAKAVVGIVWLGCLWMLVKARISRRRG